VHVGEVADQKVKRHVELAGFDVILVHRMLKNMVPVAEYVLMTDPVAALRRSFPRRLGATTRFEFDTLPFTLGMKEPAQGFRNLGRGAEEVSA